MNKSFSTGWMKLGLRAQVCSQCRPVSSSGDPFQYIAPHSCEGACALFRQLPRLGRFLERHHAKPPAGYEEFVLKMLCDSAAETSHDQSTPISIPNLHLISEALAICEHIVSLSNPGPIATPQSDCARRSFALGQLGVHGNSGN